MSNHDPATDTVTNVVETGPHVSELQRLAHRHRKHGNKGMADLLEENSQMGEHHAEGYLKMLSSVGSVARRYRDEGKLLG